MANRIKNDPDVPASSDSGELEQTAANSGAATSPVADSEADQSPLAAWILRLRDGVTFHRRESREADAADEYVVEDTTRDKFYRIGEREFAIVTAIDGVNTLEQIAAETRGRLHGVLLPDAQVLEIGRWLLATGLGHLAEHPTHGEVERAESLHKRKWLGWLNPIFLKFRVGNPDSVLDALHPLLGWLLGPVGAVLGIVIALLGGLTVLGEWDRFAFEMQGMLGPDRWWLLLAVWLGLKGFHELAHGLACKRYGGHVREWGVLFILFAPLGAWVNVTSSWRFPSKWQRIHVAIAGMWGEVVIAGVAAICWSHCEPGLLRFTLQNIMVSASVVTILFNMNPLMRFDGYFILSELVGIPNLAGRGQHSVTRQWQRALLGVQRPASTIGWGRWLFITGYGWAAFCWRILIGLGILITCMTLLHGFGLVLAVVCGVMSYLWPLYRTGKFIAVGDGQCRPHPLRVAASALLVTAMVWASWTVIPWPGRTIAHGIVDYAPRTPVRAETAGFLTEISLIPGSDVVAGSTLCTLQNAELETRAVIVQASYAESTDRSRYFLAASEMAAWRSEEERRDSLAKQVEESGRLLCALVIQAPVSGRVLGRDFDQLEGTWVEPGALLCEIANETEKEVVFAVPMETLRAFSDVSQRTGSSDEPLEAGQMLKRVSIVTAGIDVGEMEATLDPFQPVAGWHVPHPALSGHVGGPLAVHPVTDSTSASPRWQLLTPHVTGRARLNAEQSQRLRSGERILVVLHAPREAFAPRLIRVASDWMSDKVETAWRMSTLQ